MPRKTTDGKWNIENRKQQSRQQTTENREQEQTKTADKNGRQRRWRATRRMSNANAMAPLHVKG